MPPIEALLAGSDAEIWEDIQAVPATDSFCLPCKMASIRSANRGSALVALATKPGQIFFVDIIYNPSHNGLTPSTYFPYYLIAVCNYSRYTAFMGMQGIETDDVIAAVEELCTNHKPSNYGITDIEELHSDAGSQLRSQELKVWGEQPNVNIKLIASAPEHQEQNGLSERHWQECRKIAFKLLCHARFHLRFFDPALIHGSRIHNVLPLKSCMVTTPDGETIPSTAFALYYSKKPNVARYRVFGCPAIAKVYRRQESETGRSLDSRTLVQRGVRAIHIGFPTNQAGWLLFCPATGTQLVSADVCFDETFQSSLAYNHLAFHDAYPTRTQPHDTYPDLQALSRTGVPPFDFSYTC